MRVNWLLPFLAVTFMAFMLAGSIIWLIAGFPYSWVAWTSLITGLLLIVLCFAYAYNDN